MSDQKPIILAATAGGLALTANGVAAAIAISATGQPQAVVFGAIGLAAAFIGLVTITLWACCDTDPRRERRRERACDGPRDGQAQDRQPHERVFTPWNEAPHDGETRALEPIEFAAMVEAEEEAEAFEAAATPITGGAAIIYLADWVKSHERRATAAY